MGTSLDDTELVRRKSWVTAIPIEAKASEVRSHARNVRSTNANPVSMDDTIDANHSRTTEESFQAQRTHLERDGP